MGSNGTPKKRGFEHYLHKQWIATKTGKELHNEAVKRERALPAKHRVVKCKRTPNPWEDAGEDRQ